MTLGDTPFVLLDDARPGGAAHLFRRPVSVIRADSSEAVPAALEVLRRGAREGCSAAGFLAYEAGFGLAGARTGAPIVPPLLWFGLFEREERLSSDALETMLPDPASAWAGAPRPNISEAAHRQRVERILEHIRAGDLYQANLTFAAEVPWAGSPLALYALLRQRAAAGYGGVVWTGERWLLSFSPELFFALEGGKLRARPMKGTAPRCADPEADTRAARALAQDEKQRAENLMIVDLMRNDLARIARPGSVAVPERFEVETYPTVHQMVSGVTASLARGKDAIDVLAALFPCGSITGAPKIKAMELLAGIEAAPRGAYCGTIGRIAPDGDALFNVAIRTLALGLHGDARLGLGSGIVADSQPIEEWQECLAKSAFVTAGERAFDLIETMRFDPEQGVVLLDRHLARMKASAALFGFEFDRHAARNELQAATFRLRDPARVRLVLSPGGALAIGIAPLPGPPAEPVSVAIVPRQVARDDFRLAHKTSRRPHRRTRGAWETLYTDDEGFLTEGSFTSIFVRSADGVLVTPPLSRGLLPGVLRAELLETGRAIEGELRPRDLARGFLLGNALRGLVSAVTIVDPAHAAL